jgi:hypothetical protein
MVDGRHSHSHSSGSASAAYSCQEQEQEPYREPQSATPEEFGSRKDESNQMIDYVYVYFYYVVRRVIHYSYSNSC